MSLDDPLRMEDCTLQPRESLVNRFRRWNLCFLLLGPRPGRAVLAAAVLFQCLLKQRYPALEFV